MSRTVFRNVRIITPEGLLEHHAAAVEDGVIRELIPQSALPDPASADAGHIDGAGRYLSPGFIDLHCHGGGGHDFMDGTPQAFAEACRLHARHGTTTVLPTTLAGDETELRQVFDAYHQVKDADYGGAFMQGIHLEGPYFSAEYKGAQDEAYLCAPTPDSYRKLYEWSGDSIVCWSAAPELPGAAEFGRFMRERGILGSVGHSAATYEQVLEAYENGFGMITHLYSGMSGITRCRGIRVPGVVESAYLIDGIGAELIADGCHLPPSLLLMAYRFIGPDRLALVTDSMRGAGMPEGESILGSLARGQRVVIERGVAYMPDRQSFAGSVCTADRLVRTMSALPEVPLCDAVKMASLTPARLIGIDDCKGSIAPGKDADLLLFDEEINISLTMIRGKTVFKAF